MLRGAVPEHLVQPGADATDNLHHDEALGTEPVVPAAVVTDPNDILDPGVLFGARRPSDRSGCGRPGPPR